MVRARATARGGVLERRAATVSAAVVVLATPVAAWYLIGDLGEVPAGATPDHVVAAPTVSAATVRVVGIAAVVLAVAGLVVVLRCTRSADGSPHRVLLALLVPAGVIAAYATRAVTSGSIGVNFGAIFAELVLFPLAALLLLCGVGYGVRRRWR